MNPTTDSGEKLTLIDTLEELHYYLKEAIVLEHATLPPYLTALYSIKPGANLDAFNIIRVVAIEEMLHLTLAANVLNAVGGAPSFTFPGFMPNYPTYLPNGETDFMVNLERFSPQAVELFMQIERPTELDPERSCINRTRHPDSLVSKVINQAEELHFFNIGEFYEEIENGLDRLYEQMGDALFSGDPKRQITPEYYYSGGGEIIPVTDMPSAKAALNLIMEQGEGHGGSIEDEEGEISHYHRFQQLQMGRYYVLGDTPNNPTGESLSVDWDAVYPIKTNAKLADYGSENSELYQTVKGFNTVYFNFLQQLEVAFNGRPEVLIPAVVSMFRLRDQASVIMRNPLPGADRLNAAPTFEINPA